VIAWSIQCGLLQVRFSLMALQNCRGARRLLPYPVIRPIFQTVLLRLSFDISPHETIGHSQALQCMLCALHFLMFANFKSKSNDFEKTADDQLGHW